MLYIISIIFIIIILFIMYDSYAKIDITKYYIKNNKIDKNIKILLLSDLHNRNIKDELNNIIKKSNPDIIILSGDMVENYPIDANNFINMLEIFDNYTTYYLYGNHEDVMLNKEKYDKIIEKSNLILINDDSVELSKNIRLYGLFLPEFLCDIKYKTKLNSSYINDKIGKINKKKYNILIAHNPLDADLYSDYGFDITISGHIHGGIIDLPIFGPLLSPERKFFPKYSKGIYKLNNMFLIVSRGLGFSKILSFRMFNHAEVVIINLEK